MVTIAIDEPQPDTVATRRFKSGLNWLNITVYGIGLSPWICLFYFIR
jgi:hypothetical protein